MHTQTTQGKQRIVGISSVSGPTSPVQPTKDFFLSYTGVDRTWAEWIAFTLEEAGYTTVIQAWDSHPGMNFVAMMNDATKQTEQTIAVLSAAYLESEFGFAEWAAAFRRDPTGSQRRLVPVRIEACEVQGVLGPETTSSKPLRGWGIQTGKPTCQPRSCYLH